MKYIRSVQKKLTDVLGNKPVTILFGARQVGKTTVVKELLTHFTKPLYIACDDPVARRAIENKGSADLERLVRGHDIVVLDEAQVVENIGVSLKLLADANLQTPIIATGSSSFELANKLNEPLTGRNTKTYMFPLSLAELVRSSSELEVERSLDSYITYGLYPAIAAESGTEKKQKMLLDLTRDYLYKDLFTLGDIRNPFAFQKVVQQLALRIGSEVQYEDIAKNVGISSQTVQHYVDLLEQAFIVFRIRPYFTNKTNEITKNHKVYFYDTGICNSVVGNFTELDLRADKGHLFENFFVAEKMKQFLSDEQTGSLNFWRKKIGAEIDLLETHLQHGVQKAYEVKWIASATLPRSFRSAYGDVPFEVVTRDSIVGHFTQP
jgi:uncharacterized protein